MRTAVTQNHTDDTWYIEVVILSLGAIIRRDHQCRFIKLHHVVICNWEWWEWWEG